jgi:DNA-binding transcriptional LysR family regulator
MRQLRYFVAVAEELHFRRAAERLHVAQPAVSEQVRKLEDELGVRLLNRTQRSVSLTDAGAAMLAEARTVLEQAERAVAAARDARDSAAVRLRVGYPPDSLPSSVPRGLQRFAKSMPNARVSLSTGNTRKLIEELRANRIDAAIVSVPAPTAGLHRTPLEPQAAVVALPVMHRDATDEVVDFERLVPERIILLPREVNPAFHDAIIAFCSDAGLSPTFIHPLEPRVELALLAVASGEGMAVLPECVAASVSVPGVRLIALAADRPVAETVVLTRPHNDDLTTKAFVSALAEAARRAPVSAAARLGVAA